MGWLDDLDHRLRFECAEGHLTIFVVKSGGLSYHPQDCETCGQEALYAGVEKQKMQVVTKVAYEKNGIKAYQISDGKGGVTCISKEKYHYLESAGTVKPFYTPAYEEHLINTGRADWLAEKDLTKMKRRPKGGVREVMGKALKGGGAKEVDGATLNKAPERRHGGARP